MESWLAHDMILEASQGSLNNFFTMRENRIVALLTKVTEGLLNFISAPIIKELLQAMEEQFELGRLLFYNMMQLNGAAIQQESDYDIKIEVVEYMRRSCFWIYHEHDEKNRKQEHPRWKPDNIKA